MKLNLYFLRHKITYFNFYNFYAGNLDVPIMDSKKIDLKIPKIDLILCSTMIRCQQTLSCLNIPTKINVIKDDRLIEAGYGALTGKSKFHSKFKRTMFNNPPSSNYYKSESCYQSGLRAKECIDQHLKHLNNNSNILIISHKNTLNGLHYILTKKSLKLDNNQLKKVSYYPLKNLNKLKV